MRYLPSGTAEGLAYLRYRETLRPPEEMICNDYLAYHFASWWTRMAAIMIQPLPNSLVEWSLELQGRGVVGFIAARTRMFDDYVEQQIADGIQQFVILGAGLDSRAYRFAKQLRGKKTFEVDHPITQIEKKIAGNSGFQWSSLWYSLCPGGSDAGRPAQGPAQSRL